MTPGTLTAKLPWPVSIRPAAISRLLLETALNISCWEMPKLSSLAGSMTISSMLLALAVDVDVEHAWGWS